MYLDENILLNPVLEDFSYILIDFEVVSESSIGINNPFKKIINLLEKLFESFFSYVRNLINVVSKFKVKKNQNEDISHNRNNINKTIQVHNFNFSQFRNILEKALNKLNMNEIINIMEEYRLIFSSDNVSTEKIEYMEKRLKENANKSKEMEINFIKDGLYLDGKRYITLSGEELTEEKIESRTKKLTNLLENSQKLINQKRERINKDILKMKSLSKTLDRLVSENNIRNHTNINSGASFITLSITSMVKMDLEFIRTILDDIKIDIFKLNKLY